jgi:hypothetical protein
MKNYRTYSAISLAFLLINIYTFSTGCNIIGADGNGKVVKENRTVNTFNSLDVSGAFDIILTQGETQSVTIEADENLMSLIRTEVRDNELRIYTKGPIHDCSSMKAYITVKELKEIDISGAVDLQTSGKFTQPELKIEGSGASDSKLELAVQTLSVDCSGGSKLTFSGTAQEARMEVSGAVDIFAYDLATEKFSLEISGAGKAQINVSKELNAEISGAGDVRYKGNPARVIEDVTGAGSIKKAD